MTIDEKLKELEGKELTKEMIEEHGLVVYLDLQYLLYIGKDELRCIARYNKDNKVYFIGEWYVGDAK